ncbi:MAG: hypothetical protein CSA44_02320 [Gammaproteobacteria bacterium]|nr:MAG: hypothetical protein CSA44_02320 [Gammaproteobacteria bacterium]
MWQQITPFYLNFIDSVKQLSGQCCWVCKQPGANLCSGCLDNINKPAYYCYRCGQSMVTQTAMQYCRACLSQPPPFEQLYFIGTYHQALADMVIAAKIARQTSALAALQTLVYYEIAINRQDWQQRYAGYKILPVPTPKSRLIQRGFNLPRIIAQLFADEMGLPIIGSHMVTLPWYQPKQAKMNRLQRQKNRHNYQIHHKLGKKILIIDDIVTTGNTVRELAVKLQQNHVETVAVWAIARGQSQ